MFPAGVFCAIVSHPADTIVSKLNQNKGSNFVDVAKSLGLLGELLDFVLMYLFSLAFYFQGSFGCSDKMQWDLTKV